MEREIPQSSEDKKVEENIYGPSVDRFNHLELYPIETLWKAGGDYLFGKPNLEGDISKDLSLMKSDILLM